MSSPQDVGPQGMELLNELYAEGTINRDASLTHADGGCRWTLNAVSDSLPAQDIDYITVCPDLPIRPD